MMVNDKLVFLRKVESMQAMAHADRVAFVSEFASNLRDNATSPRMNIVADQVVKNLFLVDTQKEMRVYADILYPLE
jgi:hypothetical protein